MGRMEGKVALISGGAEGIGGTVGRLFVAEGGRVMLGDVQADKAAALADELGENAASVELDVRDLDAWEKAVAAAVDRFGKLTTLCNVAGISEPGGVTEVELDSWQRTIDINLNGTFNGCRAAIPAIAESGEPGAVVNVGSMLALRAGGGFAAYCASKAAVTALTKTIALDCAAKGLPIRANTVHPGAIRTPMFERYLEALPGSTEEVEAMFAANHPMGRIGEAEEVAKAILFLASDEASFTSGVDLTVDGAGTIRE
ncbi:SDR family oxidoreductase [Parasphingopyxis algicola]|uniref:SDR family NAD(P)-dependent oxidoreductase n=1 Tax=Parasphingopyxis algicola TaxID=2026624 RepID=UPI0015A2A84D|nr:SDR family oxidoreductase [Parasphingopyxis algicola]QLC25410.1 SDR family oxidoreductase [Parasphingopyxis algicola]